MNDVNTKNSALNRPLVGIIALICLGVSLAIWAFKPEHDAAQGAFMRVGLVMGALWLALPQHGESLAWARAIPVIIAVAILLSRGGRYFLLAVPLLIVVLIAAVFIRPKPPKPRITPRR